MELISDFGKTAVYAIHEDVYSPFATEKKSQISYKDYREFFLK